MMTQSNKTAPASAPLRRVLIANRGAVAARVLRALHQLGLESVVVHSDIDAGLPYVKEATEAYLLPGDEPAATYLNQDAILDIARRAQVQAIHPGYGFLSENADFARRVEQAGLCYIGPSSRWIAELGEKTRARRFMHERGMPQSPSSEILPDDLAQVAAAARAIGYPVLIKPATGGGGIGMIPVASPEALADAWASASAIAQRSFGQASLYLEKLIERPRHIEFQFLADRHGQVRALFERDCSVQRRHQKVLEESRAPGIEAAELDAMAAQLEQILGGIGYDVIGTVEMLYTPQAGFSFLEVNTRLQVEHAVTEQTTGIDIVAAQIRLAAGERLEAVLPETPVSRGHAIEARIYAEDPRRFFPSPGRLTRFEPPAGPGIRLETGYAEGCQVPRFYDPLLAKLIASGETRAQALQRLREALKAFAVEGVKTNIPFLLQVLDSPDYIEGRLDIGLAARVLADPARAVATLHS
ncbi:acetyl-CoA carboxylase biotin carboxylase subunit [Bordetella trematum]|uniref:acetyl-CoA carboxylase biotin carboxylase subunit n=1 Tax=Bordetella trematum TaxID=123899 RepID=UPI001EE661BA|nr:biotin carboxylase N-terminal domain-containing protein [Bordetella trematum]